MPLTKSFRETVMARAEKDAEFRLAGGRRALTVRLRY